MLLDLLKTMRPLQWTKNLLVFAGLVFAGKATDPDLVFLAVIAFIAFCLVSSAVYFLNDIVDSPRDRLHPVKKDRPIAAGRLGLGAASGACVVLGIAGLIFGAMLPYPAMAVVYIYFFLNLLYSMWLKKVVIIDLMTVAAGFVLRVVVGTLAIGVETSHWLLICTFLLSLFLGFGKRRNELTLLDSGATGHRGVLAHYSPVFLDQMIAVVTPSTLVCYILYTVSPETVYKFGSHNLLYTVPFVIYGIFRYLYLIHERRQGGDPTSLVARDPWLMGSVVCWVVAVWLVIY